MILNDEEYQKFDNSSTKVLEESLSSQKDKNPVIAFILANRYQWGTKGVQNVKKSLQMFKTTVDIINAKKIPPTDHLHEVKSQCYRSIIYSVLSGYLKVYPNGRKEISRRSDFEQKLQNLFDSFKVSRGQFYHLLSVEMSNIDKTLSELYLKRAEEHNYLGAELTRARALLIGKNKTPSDMKKGLLMLHSLVEKAAKQKEHSILGRTCNFLGYLHENGNGCKKDEELALSYYLTSYNNGNGFGAFNLAQIKMRKLSAMKKEISNEIINLLKFAARRKVPNALVRLGLEYLHGNAHVKKNRKRGLYLILQARRMGFKEAENVLDHVGYVTKKIIIDGIERKPPTDEEREHWSSLRDLSFYNCIKDINWEKMIEKCNISDVDINKRKLKDSVYLKAKRKWGNNFCKYWNTIKHHSEISKSFHGSLKAISITYLLIFNKMLSEDSNVMKYFNDECSKRKIFLLRAILPEIFQVAGNFLHKNTLFKALGRTLFKEREDYIIDHLILPLKHILLRFKNNNSKYRIIKKKINNFTNYLRIMRKKIMFEFLKSIEEKYSLSKMPKTYHSKKNTESSSSSLSSSLSSSSSSSLDGYPIRFYPHKHMCKYCDNVGEGYKQCSRCCAVKYCCVECQRKDWSLKHKKLCSKNLKTIINKYRKMTTNSIKKDSISMLQKLYEIENYQYFVNDSYIIIQYLEYDSPKTFEFFLKKMGKKSGHNILVKDIIDLIACYGSHKCLEYILLNKDVYGLELSTDMFEKVIVMDKKECAKILLKYGIKPRLIIEKENNEKNGIKKEENLTHLEEMKKLEGKSLTFFHHAKNVSMLKFLVKYLKCLPNKIDLDQVLIEYTGKRDIVISYLRDYKIIPDNFTRFCYLVNGNTDSRIEQLLFENLSFEDLSFKLQNTQSKVSWTIADAIRELRFDDLLYQVIAIQDKHFKEKYEISISQSNLKEEK